MLILNGMKALLYCSQENCGLNRAISASHLILTCVSILPALSYLDFRDLGFYGDQRADCSVTSKLDEKENYLLSWTVEKWEKRSFIKIGKF
jgi:hypothetical protein